MPFTGSFNIQGSFGEISAANFDSGNAPDTHALFANGEGGTEWRAPAGGGGGASYLIYAALMTQDATNAPVANVLENTLGGAPVWTRQEMGSYAVTLTGAFTVGRTAVMPFIVYDPVNEKVPRFQLGDIDNCYISVQNLGGEAAEWEIASPYFIEIRVYP